MVGTRGAGPTGDPTDLLGGCLLDGVLTGSCVMLRPLEAAGRLATGAGAGTARTGLSTPLAVLPVEGVTAVTGRGVDPSGPGFGVPEAAVTGFGVETGWKLEGAGAVCPAGFLDTGAAGADAGAVGKINAGGSPCASSSVLTVAGSEPA
jgi:hypothetical protein